MGTRNLTMVISNGKTKVAQYGQWDGYPGGQGSDILGYLKQIILSGQLGQFKTKVDNVSFLTDEQAEQIEKDDDFDKTHPYLSRDCAAEIINAIHFGKMKVNDYPNDKKEVDVKILGLSDYSEFAADSLFCEWAYVIDLDKGVFEVYQGFNQTPLTETDRFFPLQAGIKDSEDKYYPVKLIKSYPLENLPKEDVFINECDPKEEEEEAF